MKLQKKMKYEIEIMKQLRRKIDAANIELAVINSFN